MFLLCVVAQQLVSASDKPNVACIVLGNFNRTTLAFFLSETGVRRFGAFDIVKGEIERLCMISEVVFAVL